VRGVNGKKRQRLKRERREKEVEFRAWVDSVNAQFEKLIAVEKAKQADG